MKNTITNSLSEIKSICTLTNKKLGGKILQCNMPYITSCRSDAPCKKVCYCHKGHIFLANKHHVKRYNAFLADADAFFEKIASELSKTDLTHFRWHASGDIVNERYFEGMVSIAKQFPNIKFLAFTKKYEIVNDWLTKGNELPANLSILFSTWGAGWNVPNPHNLPCSYVKTGNELFDSVIPTENTHNCSGFCGTCVEGEKCCWSLGRGESVILPLH